MEENNPQIMCTLTAKQALGSEESLREMWRAGMRSVRINTAHLSGVEQLDQIAFHLKNGLTDLRLLIDTKGPEMRTTEVDGAGDILLQPGQLLDLMGSEEHTDKSLICVNYPTIHQYAQTGDIFLIDDGKIHLLVIGVDGDIIHTRVITGGVLGSKKGIALKDKDLPLPALSVRDREFVEFASQSALIDEIAHSFVRSANDLEAVRAAMPYPGKPIIAKIENQQGLDNLNEIALVADALLIARGDLTASLGAQAVPGAQQSIAAMAKKHHKPLYLATNILPSLMTGLTPSKNDLDGIATALSQGVDVFLLTNETATGANPLLTVNTLDTVLRSSKRN